MIKIPFVRDVIPDKRVITNEKINKYYGGFISGDTDEELPIPIPDKPKRKRKSKWN